MKRILIPTDFSENAHNAINYGLELFKKTKCTFHIIHINPIPPYSGAGTSVKGSSVMLKEKVLTQSKKDLKKLVDFIKEHHNNELHSFVSMAKYDFFTDGIKKEVEDKVIDLIIMGTKGASWLKKVAIGSNTGDVITKLKCPLLAVPENSVYRRLKEIAFPTDFHIAYDIKVLDTLLEMVSMNNSVLRVVHISKKGEVLREEQNRNKDFLHDSLRDIDHSFHTLTGVKLETSVQCFIESRDIDMMAMVAKNLNYFQRILFRPTVEEISYHTDIPFLVLHE